MIILMGVAGAGKSLQGRMFAEDLGYSWISTGEIFRNQLSDDRKKDMLDGKLLGDVEVIQLVDKAIKEILDDDKKAVLDGFPRTIIQAEWLLDQTKHQRFNIRAVFNLLASKEVVHNRLLSRGRADDNEEVIKERFKEYDTKTLPIISFFQQNGINVYEIDANKTPEEVHASMMKLMTI